MLDIKQSFLGGLAVSFDKGVFLGFQGKTSNGWGWKDIMYMDGTQTIVSEFPLTQWQWVRLGQYLLKMDGPYFYRGAMITMFNEPLTSEIWTMPSPTPGVKNRPL